MALTNQPNKKCIQLLGVLKPPQKYQLLASQVQVPVLQNIGLVFVHPNYK